MRPAVRARTGTVLGTVFSTVFSAVGALLAGWLMWHLLGWAVWRAEFSADPAACQALQRQGACWGVVTEKGWQWLSGRVIEAAPGQAWQPAGLPLTLWLFGASWLLSWPLAIALALARRSSHAWLNAPAVAFIEGVRGVPVVTLLFMAAFLLPLLWPQGEAPALLWRATAVLSVFSAVYLAEIVRGGLQTVPKEQSEAAQTLGLGSWATQWRIVLPQALRAVLPALTNHAIGLIKDSSLVMVIGLHELTGGLSLSLSGDPVWRAFYFEAYLFIGMVYALMCLALSRWGRWLEARWPQVV